MNIGEISKPSVDRTQVDKKLKVNQADPVLKTQETSDLIELSEESQKRYQQEHEKHHSKPEQVKSETKGVDEKDVDVNEKSPAIDLRV